MREILLRLVYCEVFGQDASFGYINAIKFAEQTLLLDKKIGIQQCKDPKTLVNCFNFLS